MNRYDNSKIRLTFLKLACFCLFLIRPQIALLSHKVFRNQPASAGVFASLRAAFPSDSPDLTKPGRLGIPSGSDFNGRPAAAVSLAREHHHGLPSHSPGAFCAP